MVVERAFGEAKVSSAGLTFEDFCEAMRDSKVAMHVDVQSDV